MKKCGGRTVMKLVLFPASVLLAFLFSTLADDYTDPPPPRLSAEAVTNGQRHVTFTPYPSAEQFRMLKTDSLGLPWLEDLSGSFSGHSWTAPDGPGNSFYRLQVEPLSSNDVLIATVANRLCYGPTPELLDRLRTIGPQAFITEQLNPNTITENVALTHTNVNFTAGRLGIPPNIISSVRNSTGPGTASIHDLR